VAPPASKLSLANLPTPLHRLDRASHDLQAEIWIKRDDLTGLALGGNKARKLEYLLADAFSEDAQVIVTCGGIHSNFIRQLGAACAQIGLECAAAVMDLPYEYEPVTEGRLNPNRGNPELSRLFGVDLRHHSDGTWEKLYAHEQALADEYAAKRKRVYRIPVGGSSPLGAFAFYQAAQELAGHPFDHIIHSTSSGSTQTGLAYAFRSTPTQILGIAADPEPNIADDFAVLGRGLADLLKQEPIPAKDFKINFDFVGPGYGVPDPRGDQAIEYLAKTEGILLDPIYTGKAFAALIELVKTHQLKGRVLFWHTGGVPSLFARN
jgi:1-aminocyclopropane-1-carboxylate deaminase/D-cysteine desulfhydrase-like pyridoxal-dependent ACC family enzyme